MKPVPRILITMGEPASIAPELLVKIAQQKYLAEIVVLANRTQLNQVANDLSLPLTLSAVEWSLAAKIHRQGHLLIENIELPETPICAQLNRQNAYAVLTMLRRANQLALEKKVSALVTAPVNKAILNQVDKQFMGHTEFFATQAKVNKVVMMLATKQLRVALVTTHIPLAKVSQAINRELIRKVVKIIHESFVQLGLNEPKIAVCGLNPHAGENGLLGEEDQKTVLPVLLQLQQEGFSVKGPLPSDSLFTQNNRAIFDVFLAMYHDQGLPVVKAIGFGQCANITLGLPYIRTSVDHGTALDIAGKNIASAGSLDYAVRYAIDLSNGHLPQ